MPIWPLHYRVDMLDCQMERNDMNLYPGFKLTSLSHGAG